MAGMYSEERSESVKCVMLLISFGYIFSCLSSSSPCESFTFWEDYSITDGFGSVKCTLASMENLCV